MRWNGFWFFILVIALLGGAAGFLAGWAKKHEKKGIMKGIVWGFVVFFACFSFPLWNEHFPLKWTNIISTVSAYGIIAAGLYGVYGEDRGPSLYPRMVLFTVIGMVCRYFLEFGEVSNTYNFTPFNIVVYLLVVPVFTILAYEFVGRTKNKEE